MINVNLATAVLAALNLVHLATSHQILPCKFPNADCSSLQASPVPVPSAEPIYNNHPIYGSYSPPNYFESNPFSYPSHSYPDYAPPKHNGPFVPAPPGKTPRCARGKTFCEKVDPYPTELIQNLVTKTNYNFRSLFAEESAEGVPLKRKSKTRVNQNRSQKNGGNTQGWMGNGAENGTSRLPTYHTNDDFNGNPFGNFTPIEPQSSLPYEAYPISTYQLPPSPGSLADLYRVTSVQRRTFDFVTQFDNHEWWKRNSNQNNEPQSEHSEQLKHTNGSHARTKRQAATELCPTRSQFIMPKAAVNSQGQWKYIVNVNTGQAPDGQKYTQLVKSETCLTTECNGLCSVPNGYSSKCEQKYVQKRLVALESTGRQLENDIFWFPHCCICQIAPDIT